MKRELTELMILLSLVCGINLAPKMPGSSEFSNQNTPSQTARQQALSEKQILSRLAEKSWKEARREGKRHKLIVEYNGNHYFATLIENINNRDMQAWLILDSSMNPFFNAGYQKIAKTASIAYFAQDKNKTGQMLLRWIRELRAYNKSTILHDSLEHMLDINPIIPDEKIAVLAGMIGSSLKLDELKQMLVESIPGTLFDYINKETKTLCKEREEGGTTIATRDCMKQVVQAGGGTGRMEQALYKFLDNGRVNLEKALDILRTNNEIWSYEEANKFHGRFVYGFLNSDYALEFWRGLQPQNTWERLQKLLIPKIDAKQSGEDFKVSELVLEAVSEEGSVKRAFENAEKAYKRDIALCYANFERFYTSLESVNSLFEAMKGM